MNNLYKQLGYLQHFLAFVFLAAAAYLVYTILRIIELACR